MLIDYLRDNIVWIIITLSFVVSNYLTNCADQRNKKQRLAKNQVIYCRLMELARLEADKGNRNLSSELAELSRRMKGAG